MIVVVVSYRTKEPFQDVRRKSGHAARTIMRALVPDPVQDTLDRGDYYDKGREVGPIEWSGGCTISALQVEKCHNEQLREFEDSRRRGRVF